MRRLKLYAVVAVAITAIMIVVGCNSDFGDSSEKADAFLDKFHPHQKVIKRFYLTYDGNGNDTGKAPEDKYCPYDSGTLVSVLDKNTLWKRGYEFRGWNTLANGDGDSYRATDRITLTKNDTLYAQWNDLSDVSFQVIVDTRPIIGTGASGSGTFTVGTFVRINAGTPPKNWQFQHWATTSKDVEFANADESRTMFTMPNNDVTVTAVFVALAGDTSSFNDSRDGKTYRKVKIGEQTWMAQNLNYLTESGSWCYDNNTDNCNTYGRLYDWDVAMTVCPAGWRLPDTADWSRLFVAVGGSGVAGKTLKAKSGWNNNGNGTDEYGFSAMPGGLHGTDGSFYHAGSDGYWWTATEDGSGNAYGRSLYYGYDNVDEYDHGVDNGFSLRCIKND
jgi:uncharacterized protein (TIGR02145 family)